MRRGEIADEAVEHLEDGLRPFGDLGCNDLGSLGSTHRTMFVQEERFGIGMSTQPPACRAENGPDE